MKSIITKGVICLKDDYSFVYRIARIEYEEWENGNFEYRFFPFYNVIGAGWRLFVFHHPCKIRAGKTSHPR